MTFMSHLVNSSMVFSIEPATLTYICDSKCGRNFSARSLKIWSPVWRRILYVKMQR